MSNAACAGRDNDKDVKDFLADMGDFVAPFGVPAPESVSELFYPPRVKEIYPVYANRAKRYCWGADKRHPCKVRKECLLWAIESNEEHGIWGGMSHRERNAMLRKADLIGVDYETYVQDGIGTNSWSDGVDDCGKGNST